MDRSLVCRECGVTFVFTQGEQEFYQSRGLANPPSRCPKCRAARRAQQGGPTSFSATRTQEGAAPGATSVASRPLVNRPMYPATCARCGQQTQVPFQPRGDRPVYCSTCFHSERTSLTPSWAAAPSRLPSAADVLPEEGRRERRNRRAEQRVERGDRVRYNRRSRDFLVDEDDEA